MASWAACTLVRPRSIEPAKRVSRSCAPPLFAPPDSVAVRRGCPPRLRPSVSPVDAAVRLERRSGGHAWPHNNPAPHLVLLPQPGLLRDREPRSGALQGVAPGAKLGQ